MYPMNDDTVEASDSYTVVAQRWSGGWELHVGGVGVTQSRTLGKAVDTVRDYLATVFDLDDASDIEVVVTRG